MQKNCPISSALVAFRARKYSHQIQTKHKNLTRKPPFRSKEQEEEEALTNTTGGALEPEWIVTAHQSPYVPTNLF